VASHDAVVVEPQQLDHVEDVGLVLDPTRGGPRRIGEYRVGHHPPLLDQLGPDLLREGEVGGAVAVQVTDLPAADGERKLAAPARARLDPWPGGDFLRDLLACC
jgi:hypothetical protein